MNKIATNNINKNGFKPFFWKSHFELSTYYRLTYNDFESEKRLKKDVKYAAEAILKHPQPLLKEGRQRCWILDQVQRMTEVSMLDSQSSWE